MEQSNQRRCDVKENEMSIREQIMDIPCPPMKSYSDREYAKYRLGFHHAKKKAADAAEARERELLERQAQMIADLRQMPRNYCSSGTHTAVIWSYALEKILVKYEETK
jgi:plasmid stabilization system protein ParE